MSDVAAQTGANDDRILRMSRVFAAPREAVFRAWTDPDEFSKWWGPEGCTSHCELEPRAGGAWRSRMMHADGGEHVVGGHYLEFRAPERLVFTWAWETDGVPGHQTTVTLEFHDREGSTEIVLTQEEFETAEGREKHDGGWSSCLDCLQQYLVNSGELK